MWNNVVTEWQSTTQDWEKKMDWEIIPGNHWKGNFHQRQAEDIRQQKVKE